MESEKLGLRIDSSDITSATKALDELAVAADRAYVALIRLGDAKHGGITIQTVGPLSKTEVKPQ
jgi:hypothetical protein